MAMDDVVGEVGAVFEVIVFLGDHGRIETRTTTVIHDVAWRPLRHQWPGLNGIVIVDSAREIDG
jgi:hypothetical protein